MDKVFKDTSLEPNKKLIMLSIADNSNDDGFSYPSINNICIKTSLSKPTVIKHIKELEIQGLLISKKRNRSNGSATSKIYVIYPNENIEKLDDELREMFNQSKEALLPPQSKEALPPKGGQSKEALPLEPSLTLFNHHLFKKLNKNEKDLFLEYLSLRKKLKLQTTMNIQDRLLNKYFEFGRNLSVIESAISGNWKDFYNVRENRNNFVQSNGVSNEAVSNILGRY
jgi:DNA-binding transcriptional MocR family regulator